MRELDKAEKEVCKYVAAVRAEVSDLEDAPVKFIACGPKSPGGKQ